MYWFLDMNYFGNDEFGINIYTSKCCEIFHPKVLHANVNIEEKVMVEFKVTLNDSITEEKYGVLFFSVHLGTTLVSLDL